MSQTIRAEGGTSERREGRIFNPYGDRRAFRQCKTMRGERGKARTE